MSLDEAMLRDEIAGLLAEDFDLSLLGITDERARQKAPSRQRWFTARLYEVYVRCLDNVDVHKVTIAQQYDGKSL